MPFNCDDRHTYDARISIDRLDLGQAVTARVSKCVEINAARGQPARRSGSGMNHSWYVTFEVPRTGTLVQRRNPRLTKTFETEAEAADFARRKFDCGFIVTAGTINPHLPRRAIPSEEIPTWLDSGPTQQPHDGEAAQGPVTKPH